MRVCGKSCRAMFWARTLYQLGPFGAVLEVVGQRVLALGILDGRDGSLVDGLDRLFCDFCHGALYVFEPVRACIVGYGEV